VIVSSFAMARRPAVEPFVGVETKDYSEIKAKYNNPLVFKNVQQSATVKNSTNSKTNGSFPFIITLLLIASPLVAWGLVQLTEKNKKKQDLKDLQAIDFEDEKIPSELSSSEDENDKVTKAS
jgi:hypothetical protein